MGELIYWKLHIEIYATELWNIYSSTIRIQQYYKRIVLYQNSTKLKKYERIQYELYCGMEVRMLLKIKCMK